MKRLYQGLSSYSLLISSLSVIFSVLLSVHAISSVLKEGDRTYIVDRTGEKWDITQAVSIGFRPEDFEYGLGRNAFTPLDDRHVSDRSDDVLASTRVIGITEGGQAAAYSIPKLSSHEIANSRIGSKPVAVGY